MTDSCCQCSGSVIPREPAFTGLSRTTSILTFADHWDHFLARWGVKRYSHRVLPGLYALGNPTPDSPVFITANYTLSFDALRSALPNVDGYILVLDTKGINVWCAAGKGTFGTEELVRRIEATSLKDVAAGRTLILPQLGATGIAAHEVKKRSGFKVEYGPIRAEDLPEYLKNHTATLQMRRVRFDLRDRAVLVPMELVGLSVPMLVAAAIMFLVGWTLAAGAVVASFLAGVVLFPVLLPWLPTPNFSTKGFVLGAAVGIPFAIVSLEHFPGAHPLWKMGLALAYLLGMMAVTGYFALNFTGSTPFASKSGVKREIFSYVPAMAWMLGISFVLSIVIALANP